ncbi:hypothetical protein HYT00_02380 [Candidatus Giovannonibacteria bacterium]|nr:hypothetical protein [Candidatus Giovannonibacteria bacterium]
MKKIWIIGIALIIIFIAGGLWYQSQPSQLDGFAKCLGEKGAKFYGAFWCPHCANQKKIFGRAAKYLPYTECSSPDKQSQLQICNDAKVQGYPTWDFADGSRLSGEVPLKTLSEKTGCQLPQ